MTPKFIDGFLDLLYDLLLIGAPALLVVAMIWEIH